MERDNCIILQYFSAAAELGEGVKVERESAVEEDDDASWTLNACGGKFVKDILNAHLCPSC